MKWFKAFVYKRKWKYFYLDDRDADRVLFEGNSSRCGTCAIYEESNEI
ncbi:hypothetical protein R9C00_11765 [Flammeovirgaceae bacterium SG7u.111]|nr:hypothetical protein [Flammeovirgaceae bacterium SG7u.132]WPO38129.1 hypothetical protein R9C00_11765 [Flammeovirgaceae bacterium SG7u.111]